MKFKIGIERQRQIYLDAIFGKKSSIPQNYNSLEQLCRQSLPEKYFNYIFTGAGDNCGVKNNQEAFKKYEILPRWCRGLKDPDLSIHLCGYKLDFPILFAPIGVLELAHRHADAELARASCGTRIPMIVSSQSSISLEHCANIIRDVPWWFQLYFSQSKELTQSFVRRAEDAGASAIVLTLDTVMLGWRNLDLETAYLPFLEGKGIANYTSDPYFLACLENEIISNESKGKPSLLHILKLFNSFPGNILDKLRSKNPIKAVQLFTRSYSRPELNWDDIKWLRAQTNLPIFLKGILHAADAIKTVDTGCNGVIVSNHGGRQINNNAASLDCLADIRKNVDENFPVILDSGIRSGTDIFIALALGANAVSIGRPYVYAMHLAGHKGVEELMANYISELKILMSLTGCANIEEISRAGLVRCKT
ncbi:MAG: alpha-hydroxy-acid oxidizing protein [Saprospiraceae bacterium]|nr:alpha-hydroxy-acid oxidizing protein [Saprospiraceae bacterium]